METGLTCKDILDMQCTPNGLVRDTYKEIYENKET